MKYLEDLYSIEPNNRAYLIDDKIIIVDWNYYVPSAYKHPVDDWGFFIHKAMMSIVGYSVDGIRYRKGEKDPKDYIYLSTKFFKIELTRDVMKYTLDNKLGEEHLHEVAQYIVSKLGIYPELKLMMTEIEDQLVEDINKYFIKEYRAIIKGVNTTRKESVKARESWDDLIQSIKNDDQESQQKLIAYFADEICDLMSVLNR